MVQTIACQYSIIHTYTGSLVTESDISCSVHMYMCTRCTSHIPPLSRSSTLVISSSPQVRIGSMPTCPCPLPSQALEGHLLHWGSIPSSLQPHLTILQKRSKEGKSVTTMQTNGEPVWNIDQKSSVEKGGCP